MDPLRPRHKVTDVDERGEGHREATTASVPPPGTTIQGCGGRQARMVGDHTAVSYSVEIWCGTGKGQHLAPLKIANHIAPPCVMCSCYTPLWCGLARLFVVEVEGRGIILVSNRSCYSPLLSTTRRDGAGLLFTDFGRPRGYSYHLGIICLR